MPIRSWLSDARALPVWMLLSLLGLLAMDLDRRQTVIEELTAVRRLGQIHADAAVAHLWVEEWLSGDEIDVPALEERLRRLQEGAVTLLASPWSLAGSDHGDELQLLQQDIEQFQQITEDRLEGRRQGLQVGIGSPFDVEYDRVFNRVLQRVFSLERSFEARRRSAERRHAFRFRCLLAICGLVVLLTAWGYVRRERKSRIIERDLAEKEEHLLRLQKIEVLGHLAGGLAHDVNNYLAAIRSQCELLALELDDEKGPEAAHERLQLILGTSARAGALIDRLFAFGTDRPKAPEPVDLRRLLETMEPMLQSAAADGVVIDTVIAQDLWTVWAESVQVEQAILNLVLNAIDAVAGSGQVTVAACNRPAMLQSATLQSAMLQSSDGELIDAVEVTVTDDGRGIELQHQERIFEPFWSTKTAGSHTAGHVGLGLAVVQSAIARADGQLLVKSRPGDGTTFTLRFPRSNEPAVDPESTHPSSLEDLGGHESILLVDDHEELREAAAMLLETLGYEVRTAIDGDDAIGNLEQKLCDVVIVDLSLSDGDGLELISRLRSRFGQVLAIAYTGRPAHALRAQIDRCEALGIPLVAKNTSARELLLALRRLLDEAPIS